MPAGILRKPWFRLILVVLVIAGAWFGRPLLFPDSAESTVAKLEFERLLGTPGVQDTLERRLDLALHLSWTKDNASLISRQHDGNIVSWDVAAKSGRAIARTEAVYAFCSAEARLLVNIEDNAVLLGLEDGGFQKISQGRHDHAAFSQDCSALAIAREDENRVRIWRGPEQWADVATAQPVRNSLVLSLDGRFLAAAGGTYSEADGHRTLLEIFDLNESAEAQSVQVAKQDEVLGLWSMAFSADGSGVMLGSQVFGQSGLRHITTKTGETRWGRDGFGAYWVRALAVSPDGILLATGDERGMLRIWEVDSGVLVSEFSTDMIIQSLAFSTDGRRLAMGLWDGTIGIAISDTLIGH